ncbi:MAG: DUF1320 domain-containing protein [Comamonas sp.]
MEYATVQDLISRFGERELIQLTDHDELQQVKTAKADVALGDAHAYVDGYVGVVYQLPIAGCAKPAPEPGNASAVQMVAPPLLTRLVCDVARYYLFDDLAPEHEVYIRFKAATKELQALAAGEVKLTCPWGGQPGVSLTGNEPGEGEVLFEFSPRQVTDESLRGFA